GARLVTEREKAFQIAEAGIEYYRWHLAHAPQDFQDGTGVPGPYVHEYKDRDGQVIGNFTLTITPPAVGSTVVTVASTGRTVENPSVSRTIEVRLAIPSLARYAFIANSAMRFGYGTEVFGPIHSNEGVRFDGLAHNLVTSSRGDYDDPDHDGNNEFGVHTHLTNPLTSIVCNNISGFTYCGFVPAEGPPTTPLANRTDVFQTGRQFPVPAVDFTGFTNDLADIREETLPASGVCTPDVPNGKLCFPDSGYSGYHVVLRPDNPNTFELYRVNTLMSPPSGCNQPVDQQGNPTQPGWGSWSINTQTRLRQNLTTGGSYRFPLPANGLIFFEDDVWVDGRVNNARLTIASGKFPESANTNTSITVNRDLLYTNYDGQDVVALIGQNNINVGMNSGTTTAGDLRIDAAVVAKNGRVGRYYYRAPGSGNNRCSPYHTRSTLSLFGMIATNLRYGFAYTDNTGYVTRNIIYDANLLYGPPPSFPLTSDQYSTISWRER
ncbi:MAG: hypothetical protein AAB505_01370, partial [Patescibacteria group bacterium]